MKATTLSPRRSLRIAAFLFRLSFSSFWQLRERHPHKIHKIPWCLLIPADKSPAIPPMGSSTPAIHFFRAWGRTGAPATAVTLLETPGQ